ncbi:TetR/AcrR family transcriptional regulator [Kineosporia mesophila]|uniref:TetR/AcrR family transcriptional regulator n=1 Tax=Kineosporia mesophila TaxID=566012 RepID=A0ABP6Z3U9_9ACTN|nr:helix-turn-helix domain-containing protein [Kineosporia mesophila]MCD5352568.1 TetR/AcrR family transcriptional regulator [Kineosporia mesophila]
MRVDAQENRDRILVAAREVFAEAGEQAAITRIARRAQVSVATLYRRFPTRDDLVAGARTLMWDESVKTHQELLRSADPAQALHDMMLRLGACQLDDRGYAQAYVEAVVSGRGLDRERQATEKVMAVLLARAQAMGGLRADLTVADYRLLIAAHQGVVVAESLDPARASRRFLTTMLRSYQAPAR